MASSNFFHVSAVCPSRVCDTSRQRVLKPRNPTSRSVTCAGVCNRVLQCPSGSLGWFFWALLGGMGGWVWCWTPPRAGVPGRRPRYVTKRKHGHLETWLYDPPVGGCWTPAGGKGGWVFILESPKSPPIQQTTTAFGEPQWRQFGVRPPLLGLSLRRALSGAGAGGGGAGLRRGRRRGGPGAAGERRPGPTGRPGNSMRGGSGGHRLLLRECVNPPPK